jgi:hypothetical protein
MRNPAMAAGPAGPAGPIAPCGPESPLGPCGPAGPIAPCGPCWPRSPFGPCGPAGPIEPCRPVSPFVPAGPATPAPPSCPFGPAWPCGPCGPEQPTSMTPKSATDTSATLIGPSLKKTIIRFQCRRVNALEGAWRRSGCRSASAWRSCAKYQPRESGHQPRIAQAGGHPRRGTDVCSWKWPRIRRTRGTCGAYAICYFRGSVAPFLA